MKFIIYALVAVNVVLFFLYLLPWKLPFFSFDKDYTPERLFYSTGERVPLGVGLRYSIDQGEDSTRFNVSGFIVDNPKVKGKKVYLTIALEYEKKSGYSKELQIYLGKLDKKIGINVAEGGKISNVYKVAKVKEIYPQLKKYSQVLLVITTAISNKVLETPKCKDNPKCKEVVEYINT